MTTMAYDGVTLAVDSQANADHLIIDTVRKLISVDNAYVSWCGIYTSGLQFIDWLHGRWAEPRPPLCDLPIDWEQSSFFLIHKYHGAWKYDGSPFAVPLPPRSAQGSGLWIAKTAMHLGLDAKQAVAAACDLDAYTGLPITAVKWDAAKEAFIFSEER